MATLTLIAQCNFCHSTMAPTVTLKSDLCLLAAQLQPKYRTPTPLRIDSNLAMILTILMDCLLTGMGSPIVSPILHQRILATNLIPNWANPRSPELHIAA